MTEKTTSNKNKDKNSHGKFFKIFILLSAFFLLATAASWGWYTWAKKPLDESATTVLFRVPKGTSSVRVGTMLEKRGLIKSALAWRVYLKINSVPLPKAGLHRISASMDIRQIVDMLASKPVIEDVSVTMVEGWRIRDADKILSAKGLFPAGAYISATSHPERYKIPFPHNSNTLAGYLLPDTYRVPAQDGKVDVASLVQIQLNAFAEKFYKPYKKEISAGKRSLNEIVTMASLLEREEPNPKMRPMVAGILYKRLDSKTPLGVDATSRFGLTDWNDRKKFLAKLRDPEDPYNTRLRKGLPPSPIGAPSLDSLIAALRPKKSAYWYYLHDKQQRIHFARNAAQHEVNRKKYAVW